MTLTTRIVLMTCAAGLVIAVGGAALSAGTGEGAGMVLGVSLAAGAAVALVGFPVGLVVRSGLRRESAALEEAAQTVAGGNLNVAMDDDPSGEIGPLRRAVAGMADALIARVAAAEGELEGLRAKNAEVESEVSSCRVDAAEAKKTLTNINASAKEAFRISEQVAYAAEGLSSQVLETGEGTRRQRDRVAETATAMEEMNATVLEVARNASDSSESANGARERALAGADVVDRSVQAIGRVNELSEQLRGNMDRLGQQAESIGQVMTVITDIADQTNLLALNAAIEAARAGDVGRGFAVVADEVRKLAEKTMTATTEVGDSIKAIQQAARDNQKSMDLAAEAVEEATTLANESGEALSEIVKLVDASSGQAQSIAAASEQQSAASEEINRAIEEVNLVAADTAEGMNEAANAVKSLAGLAAELQALFEKLLGKDDTKLRQSETEMRGILPKMMQDFLRKHYGEDVYAHAMDAMGHPSFLANKSYPDKVLEQMADLAAEKTGKSREKVLYEFGFYTPGEFRKMYRRYFKTTDLKEFYLRMNETHAELTKEEPGITPPRFTYEDKGKVLVMNYHSSRALFTYFEGILNGIAEAFGQRVDIKVKPKGADTAQAVITF